MSYSWSESSDFASSPEMLPRPHDPQAWLTQTRSELAPSLVPGGLQIDPMASNYPSNLHMPHPQIYQNTDSAAQYWQATQAPGTSYGTPAMDTNTAGRRTRHRFTCHHCRGEKPTVCRSSKDLERHIKSVHQIYHRGDRFWMCPILGCARASKKWPRRDNFTCHVERMHPEEDSKEIVARALFIANNDSVDSGDQGRTPESGYISATDPYEFDAQQGPGFVFEEDDRMRS